jgi:L-malate glycosyltransferase
MKVVHIITDLSTGGAELHLFALCRQLKRAGIGVTVACLRDRRTDSRSLRHDFEIEGVRVVHLRADSKYSIGLPMRVARVLDEEKPNILHTHLPRADLTGALRWPPSPSSVRWVASIHDVYSKSWSGRRTLPVFYFVWRKADAVVAISDAVKGWLLDRGLPSEKVTVIKYGIETKPFRSPTTDLRIAWGLEGSPVIGSIGRLEPRKGHECLISAMPIILTQFPHALLLIAGHDTPARHSRKLQEQIEDLNLRRSVRLIGFQSDVPSLLGALDIFAFASRSEGFGQVVIEAMAASTPVVVSCIPALKELVEHERTGLLAEPDNPDAFARSIIWLLKHPNRAAEVSMEARKCVETNYSARRMSQETISLYQNLVDK